MNNTYNKKGLYNGYNKAHKERVKLDFYATPPEEVINILEVLNIDLNGKIILEPAVGQGHMLSGIKKYCAKRGMAPEMYYISDIVNRMDETEFDDCITLFGDEANFLGDNYSFNEADVIIMNPPYTMIEPFTIRALEIAKEKLIMLGRIQFLETKGRYENILKDNPPTDVYVYVDRIKCYKNGDFSDKTSSAQCYAWFIWDKQKEEKETRLHWIRKIEK